jgi:putative transposase
MHERLRFVARHALDMHYRAQLCAPSPREYCDLGELDCPFHDRTITVTQCGRICMDRCKINLSVVFAGQAACSRCRTLARWPS